MFIVLEDSLYCYVCQVNQLGHRWGHPRDRVRDLVRDPVHDHVRDHVRDLVHGAPDLART